MFYHSSFDVEFCVHIFNFHLHTDLVVVACYFHNVEMTCDVIYL